MSKTTSIFYNLHTHQPNTGDGNLLNIDQRDFQIHKTQSRYFSVGLHPFFLEKKDIETQLQQIEIFLQNESILAIGECGLDKVCDVDWDFQMASFKSQIAIAEQHQKPIVIHCARAFNEVMQLKKELKTSIPWIIHGFSKKKEVLIELVNQGFYISLGKKALMDKAWLETIYPLIPKDKLFLETDNKDISIEDVFLSYSKASGMPMDDLKKQIEQNFKTVFFGK